MKRWLPMALCCLVPMTAAVLLGLGLGFFGEFVTSSLKSIFLFLTSLACPLGMGLMLWLMSREADPSNYAGEKAKPPLSAANYFDLLLEQRHRLQSELQELEQLIKEEQQLLELAPHPETLSE